jgi:predicted AAA+ superfamily ATPase
MDDTDHALFSHFSAELVATALKDTPVVMVAGPRQCGKTTLVRDLVAGNREFITMDDDAVLAAAPRAPFPSAYAFLSIRNFTECTRQQIFPRRC